ncbi:MAG: ATP-binding cassette domain-containing protein [Desulfovibrionaceae bacterium]
MALISAKNVTMSFGGPKLLDDVSFQVEAGQRVCLVGRNGEGKSTLLRLLSGDLVADGGEIVRSVGLSVARLSQKVPEVLTGTIFEVVAQGLGDLGAVIADYHRVGAELAQGGAADGAARLAAIEGALEAQGGWEALTTIDMVISRLSLDPERRFEHLSGGLKRRALLARALAGAPDVLLLDEPTNHLDIDSIVWLEEFVLRHVKTLVFITHDRAFLRRIATRIIELDRGRLADWTCDYDTFVARKEEQLAIEEKGWSEFDKKLAREEAWIRQGIKARRTRNEGRVRALKSMREERRERRERTGGVSMVIQDADRSGKVVVEATGVTYAWPEGQGGAAPGAGTARPVFRDADVTILRGDRVGVIGPNGAGKTTLIHVLLGMLQPTVGTVKLGARLEIAYFDQHREQLDPDATVRHCVGLGNDVVTINGRTKHVMGYLKDFLFSADRANSPVRVLSGGERNRLLLARLFTRPSNVLVMDEPTNDLDAETLELLEDRLLEYPGTILVVSHDRAFLNNVVTSTIALEGDGAVREYVGGYDDWLRQRPAPAARAAQADPSRPGGKPGPARPAASGAGGAERASGAGGKPRKRTFKEQRELDDLTAELAALPAMIEQQELAIEAAHARLADPAFYRQPGEAITAANDALAAQEEALAATYARWETVEARIGELAALGA